MDSRVMSLSVALVSRCGLIPPSLSRNRARLVREPREMRASDDVVLFYGADMAQELTRFSAEAEDGLPPAAVLAPWLDLDPAIAAEQVRGASRARAREGERGRTRSAVTVTAVTVTAPDRRIRLSQRERQLMDLLVSGLGVRDVAREMLLTDKTVRNYMSRIYGKLNVRCQSEAILCWLGHLDVETPLSPSGV
ncbi:response regulator transcription factor [Streptomyces montanus]|uniref:Response regulator transcription factor n=1 Tax=Streptomyces montanus TaxID=2580423 RepID=A0A5R9FQZ5_9ACTN|nr:LuxR C-terminal-related transcriptional regulator [Streptomyces montanus]TLS45089.1 response regulator transcription factor [Streptomyces montanus]